MSAISAILTAWHAAGDARDAVAAAQAVLAAGGTVGASIDAFAAATPTSIDDAVVAELHQLADTALDWTHTGIVAAVAVTRWLAVHDAAIQRTAIAVARAAEQLPMLAELATRYAEHIAMRANGIEAKLRTLR